MPSIPYHYRLIALAGVLGLLLLFDLRKPRGERKRHIEYFFLLSVGGLAALFGILTDTITSAIAPEYFIVGKGIDAGDAFRAGVISLGARAGFSAGIIGAAVLLAANRKGVGLRPLFTFVGLTFVGCVALGTVFGLLQHRFGWIQNPLVASLLEPERARLFNTVWCIHLGVYVGGLLGLLTACSRVWRKQ